MNNVLTKFSLFVLFTLSIVACSLNRLGNNTCMSIAEIRSNLDQLDGAEVSVCGFLKYEFEDMNIYSSKHSARIGSTNNCISIGVLDKESVNLSQLNDQWVLVTGIVTVEFCPEDTICMASCSNVGLFVVNAGEIN